MDDDFDSPGSAAETSDEATHVTTASAAPQAAPEAPEGGQVVPVQTDHEGAGWGLVGLFKDGIGTVEVEGGQGEVELEDDANGITRLLLSGAPADTVVHLTVSPKI